MNSIIRRLSESSGADAWHRFHCSVERFEKLLAIARELGVDSQHIDSALVLRNNSLVIVVEPSAMAPTSFFGTRDSLAVAYTDAPEAILTHAELLSALEPNTDIEKAASSGFLTLQNALQSEEYIAWCQLECSLMRAIQTLSQQDLEGEPLFITLNNVIQELLKPSQLELRLELPTDYWPDRATNWSWVRARHDGYANPTGITPRLQRLLYRRETVLFVEDLAYAPDILLNDSVQNAKFRSCFLLPLVSGNKAIGILKLFYEQVLTPLPGEIEALNMLRQELSLILDRIRQHLLMQRMAMIDGLTNLFNHRFFREQLHTEYQRCLRYQKMMTLIMIDIDDFKGYNDRYGHLAGDRVLEETARTIRRTVRDIDFVARYGGEEFALILPEVEGRSGIVVADKIRRAVEVQRLLSEEGETIGEITVSCGVADNLRTAAPEEVIARADRALYWVKRHGRNLVRYDEGIEHE
jgi:diguanylate cyclase (GGDEF)-like protein